MKISVTEATGQLADLVRRAESGEEVVLTRDGRPAIRFAPFRPIKSREERLRIIASIVAAGPEEIGVEPSAAESQDFLYDELGMPA